MIVKSGEPIKIICGTPCYMAPELTIKKPYNGFKVDIWAVGIILYVMICGEYPFKGRTDDELNK